MHLNKRTNEKPRTAEPFGSTRMRGGELSCSAPVAGNGHRLVHPAPDDLHDLEDCGTKDEGQDDHAGDHAAADRKRVTRLPGGEPVGDEIPERRLELVAVILDDHLVLHPDEHRGAVGRSEDDEGENGDPDAGHEIGQGDLTHVRASFQRSLIHLNILY